MSDRIKISKVDRPKLPQKSVFENGIWQKKCPKCESLLPLACFSLRTTGYFSCQCKVCHVKEETQRKEKTPDHCLALARASYHRNKNNEAYISRRKKWAENNKEKKALYLKDYNKKNEDTLSIKRKQYYEENKEIILKKRREYVEKNKEKINLAKQQYYQQNREHLCLKGRENRKKRKKKINEYNNKCYKEDIEFRLGKLFRTRLNEVLRKNLATKKESSFKLLGISVTGLVKHIESLWTSGMSWDNYGQWRVGQPMTWHIDHIKPCNAFDLTDPEQQKICFHYTNLQPLWAIDNIRKGDNEYV